MDKWETIRNVIVKATKKTLGEHKNQTKKLYSIECQNAVQKRNEYRHKYLRYQTPDSQELFEKMQKRCKQVIQREKRKYINNMLQKSEQNYTQEKIQTFFASIKKYQKFNPALRAIKDKNNIILMEPKMKASRWQEYCEELLNGEVPETPILPWEDQRAE